MKKYFFFFFLIFLFYFTFIYGCVGSSFLCEGFLQLRQVGATLHRGARASHYRGPSHCRAQAPDAQAQQLWLTGLVAPWHVGSSQTRTRTRVSCIGRQILNHCATREARSLYFYILAINSNILKVYWLQNYDCQLLLSCEQPVCDFRYVNMSNLRHLQVKNSNIKTNNFAMSNEITY